MNIRKLLMDKKTFRFYLTGKIFLNDPIYVAVQKKHHKEISKRPYRSEIINFLLSLSSEKTCYLEIGVRNPEDNFNYIEADIKYGVDPGIEFRENPVDFKMTSDEFFQKLSTNEILFNDIKFDVIFIDGLHLAPQVDKDIQNAFKYIKNKGFIVLHDCNPPSEWHARECYRYYNTPAGGYWNGSTWKAFLKWRCNPLLYSCCIDSDWGVGILSKDYQIGKNLEPVNPFFEFGLFDANRNDYLNLVDFESFKRFFDSNS